MIIDDKKVLKLRDQWSTSKNKASSGNYKTKTAIYNAIDASYFSVFLNVHKLRRH